MREEEPGNGNCFYYLKNIIKFLISHIGLVSLVIGYTIIGGLTFEKLEADHELEVKRSMSSVRVKVIDDLWDMTDDMKVLNESMWADSVRDRLKDFERSLIKAIKTDGWDGKEELDTQQWTFGGALFYSIILITTIGYGHIAPKTDWGKVVTIFYAIPGVPLMMLCLANIGDGMAHSFRFLYWKVCCYACTKKPKKKVRRVKPIRTSRSHRMYDDMADGDMRGGGGGGSLHRNRPSERSQQNRSSVNSKTSDHLTPPPREGMPDEGRVAVLFNKYALEKEGLPSDNGHMISESERDIESRHSGRDHIENKDRRSTRRDDDEPEIPIIHQPRGRGSRRDDNSDYLDSPSMPRSPRTSERYSRHIPPPSNSKSRLSRLDEEYYYDDYEDEYEDDDDEEEDDEFSSDKPVPIWLGVMLVVAYIFGGAFLFAEWEDWTFLNSVYFCFITLTTIGFGDFVPAQKIEAGGNVELSIALCSIYLLFGIALLAMSFNLVQEEVINNVKSMARRLGIIKEDDEELE